MARKYKISGYLIDENETNADIDDLVYNLLVNSHVIPHNLSIRETTNDTNELLSKRYKFLRLNNE